MGAALVAAASVALLVWKRLRARRLRKAGRRRRRAESGLELVMATREERGKGREEEAEDS